jgi:hypothetical protein
MQLCTGGMGMKAEGLRLMWTFDLFEIIYFFV